jgi:hypothetical protein
VSAERPAARPGPGDPPDDAAAGGTLFARAYIVLLICIPSVWVVGPLGAVGALAGLLGLGLFAAWLLSRSVSKGSRPVTPVHWLLLLFTAGFAAAVCAAAGRPLLPEEYSAVLRALITLAGWLGVALFVADTLRTRVRFLSLTGFLVGMGTLLAAIGYVQFATGINVVEHLHVPGLTLHDADIGVFDRNGFHRVNATAIHALEYATVLSMLLPLAVSQAVRRRTAWSVIQSLLIAGALPLTVSRSGTLGLAIGVGFTLVVVGRRERWVILALIPVALGAVVVAVPGLLGSIRGLFVSAGTDTSITARTDDYPAVAAFFHSAPWLGRGPFTFLPSIYRTLDNQYLGSLVEGGLVGLLTMVALLLGTVVVALRLARRLPPGPDRVLALAMTASLATAMVLFASFDAYSFPMCMGTVFLLIGLVGAAVTCLDPAQPDRASVPGAPRPVSRVRRLAVAVAGLAVFGAATVSATHARPAYMAAASVVVAVPPQPGDNIYFAKRDTTGVTDILLRVLASPATRAELAADGVTDYQVALGGGSLAPYTDRLGYGDVMRVAATAATPERAAADATAVGRKIGSVLRELQAGRGIPTSQKVDTVSSTSPAVSELAVHAPVGLAASAMLGLLASVAAGAVIGGRRGRPSSGRNEPPLASPSLVSAGA